MQRIDEDYQRAYEEVAMLVIRNNQMRAFQKYMSAQFENRILRHVEKFFPEEFVSLGEDRILEEIRYGINRAKTYEITNEYDLSGYINMMFTFGRDYDVDPRLQWAARILTDTELSGSSKLDRLYEEAENHLSDSV